MSDPGERVGSDSQAVEEEPSREYRTLAETLEDGVFQLDAEGRFVAVNDAIVDRTGYARDDLVGAHVSLVVHETDVERLERTLRTGLESDGDDTTLNLVTETVEGNRVRWKIQWNQLAEDGTFEGIVGVISGAGEHNTGAQSGSVWETYESIMSVIDDADVGVFILDETFDIVWIDETVEQYFGLSRDDVVGRDKKTLIEETIRDRFADPDAFAETVRATYDDNTYVEQFECQLTAGSDREERWLEHRSKPIESGRYAGGRVELYYDITERKESERARRESEQRFRSLIDAVEEYAIFTLDPDGRLASWNEGGERITGYDSSQILGEHVSVFYTDEDRANGIPERQLARARAEGSIEDDGWRVRADGSRFWARVTITAIRDDGEIQGYAKITRDMTERRERERQLRRERDLTERILETSPVGIAVVNPDGTTERANERMAELLSVPASEMSAYSAGQREMFDANGEFLPAERRPASRAFEQGATVYDQEILLDPSTEQRTWLSVNATPITDDGGSPERVLVTATDITDLKRLADRRKRELQEREKELAAVRLATDLLETGEQPIEELLRELLTELPQFFKYPERTDARVSVGEHVAATDGFDQTSSTISAHTSTDTGTPITIEIGTTVSTPEPNANPFLEEEHELIETLATLVRFHFERQEYIDELQAETRRLEQFAYAASHDLQEPLRMVSSYLQLLERRYGDELGDDGEEFIAFAVDGAERMREMIDGLLAYSRVETRGDPFERVDLNAVLEDVLLDLERRIAETSTEITATELPTVEGDASQLRQVFQNLIINAIEYSEGIPQIEISAKRNGDQWVVSIRDEGIGIDPDETERIFEVFHRLHSREDHAGTGIGLALCRRIVERHGGEIRVDSEPGRGSTFSITLPAVDGDDGS